MISNIIRKDIYEMIKEAVNDGLSIVGQFETNHKYISRYFQFPKMSQFSSGFPNFNKSFMEDNIPLDYKSIFGKDKYPPDKIKSWKKFRDFALKDDSLSRFWEIGSYFNDKWYSPALPDLPEIHNEIMTYGSIEKLVDRYIHVSLKKEMDENLLYPIYQEWERNIFWEKLPVNIFVPILAVMFSFEQLEIDDNIYIKKMDENFQLARNNRSSYTVSTHDIVIGTATHALVLEGWSIENDVLDKRQETMNDIRTYSSAILEIEKFFAAFRSETLVETGYSQIIAMPVGWANSWQAYLPPVEVVTVKAYPTHFEKYVWLKNPTIFEKDICDKVAKIFSTLRTTTENRLILALKRLNSAFLRTDEEDSILDVTMGLETLLTSDTRTEITYKLAMRAAALSTVEKFEGLSPKDVFKSCKKIYDYRSSIIHGSKKANKKRIIKLSKENEIPTVRLGVNILRCVVKALCLHLEYLNCDKLDDLLIDTRKKLIEE